jgi:hypothetical protein
MDCVDCSEQHPPAAALVAAGVKCVICKLNGPNAVTAAIVASYRAVGIVVCFYYENLPGDVASGFLGGQAAAYAARGALVPILGAGAALAQPIYFADDQNDVWWDAVGYFVGINRVLNSLEVGVYGDGNVLDGLGAVGLITYKWQSASGSYANNGTTQPGVHIQQLTIPSISGTDADQLLQPDVGQYPRPA